MKRGVILFIFLVVASLATMPARADYTALYAFGDSLSDNGNIYALTGKTLPQSPYFDGRFSNGKVAVEYVAQALGVPLADYAFGGATSGITNADFLPTDPPELYNTGVLTQIALFTTDLGPGTADSQALYLIAAGSNDFLNGDLNFPELIAGEVIANLNTAVLALYDLGARNFLLPLLPDLGLTPGVRAQDPVGAGELSLLMLDVNLALANSYAMLQSLLPDADFTIFDTLAAQHGLQLDAASNGLIDFGNACFSGDVGLDGVVCASPDTFFYWDSEHPTTRVHALLGAQLVAALPEPPTALLAGLALLALVWRRKRAAVAMNGRALQPA